MFAGAGAAAQNARTKLASKRAEKPADAPAPVATGTATSAASVPAPAAPSGTPPARPAPGKSATTSGDAPRRNAPLQASVPASRPPVSEQDKAREAEAMTIFGARGAQKNTGNFAQRGLMAAGGALLILIAVAVWAIYFSSSDTTQMASSQEQTLSTDTSADGVTGIEAPETLATAEQGIGAPAALDAPDTAATETPDTEALADAGDTAPDGAGDAVLPEEQVDALVADALTEAPEASTPAETTLAEAGADAPATPEPQAAQDASTQGGEDSAQAPVAIASDSPQLDSETATVQSLSLPSGMAVPPVEEVAFTPPPPPPPFGTEFVFDDRGLVVATPEGALTPSGVTVFAGRPDTVPAPREGTILPAAPEAAPDAAEEPAPAPTAEVAPRAERRAGRRRHRKRHRRCRR